MKWALAPASGLFTSSSHLSWNLYIIHVQWDTNHAEAREKCNSELAKQLILIPGDKKNEENERKKKRKS